MTVWWLLASCESERERLDREWDESFGVIARAYHPATDPPQIAPEQVRGRKVLVDALRSDHPRESYEAATAAEVGLVVVDSVKSDATPSATYENGSEGYGGEVTMTAWAHPEGKLVASETYRCTAPYQNFDLGLRSGQKLAARCGGDRDTRLRFAGELVDAVAPFGSNVDAPGTRAYLALAAPYEGLMGQRAAAGAPSVAPRKVLLVAAREDGLGVWQKEDWVPPGRLAVGADQVGVVVLTRTRWEESPSVHYPCGVDGYAGTVDAIAVAHPEGLVVASATLPCDLGDPERVCRLADLIPTERCSVRPGEVAAFVAGVK